MQCLRDVMQCSREAMQYKTTIKTDKKMRKLSKEEADAMPILKKGRRTRLNIFLSQLKAGEILEVKKTDWAGKRAPYQLINRFGKRHGWKLFARMLPDETGWLITRVE